jgi:hypothetical protein
VQDNLRNNVSQACKINGVSRQHFYDIKQAYDEHGVKSLVEEALLRMANEFSANSQMRTSNELRKASIFLSGGGVRNIGLRHGLAPTACTGKMTGFGREKRVSGSCERWWVSDRPHNVLHLDIRGNVISV